jgi:serine/threonine protein phosphatase PrpC
VADKTFPGLNMSRSLGDLVGNMIGVSFIPDFLEYSLTPDDKFMIIASDGVWEFLSPEDVIREVHHYGKHDLQTGINKIAEDAWKKWKQRYNNIVDDITIVVYYFGEPDDL